MNNDYFDNMVNKISDFFRTKLGELFAFISYLF